MKKFKLLFVLPLVALLASCGGGKQEAKTSEKMSPETTEVSGALSDCYEVVEREYKINDQGIFSVIAVELERTDEALPFDATGKEIVTYGHIMSKPNIMIGFGIEFLDEDGNVLSKKPASNHNSIYSSDDVIELGKLKAGEKGTLRFSLDNEAKGATKFRISSAYEESEGSPETVAALNAQYNSRQGAEDIETEDSDNSSDGAADFDDLLKSYEKFVDKYLAYMKKVESGDMSALAELPSMMDDIEEYSKKFDAMKDDVSPAQFAKFTKIQKKFLDAAAKAAKM